MPDAEDGDAAPGEITPLDDRTVREIAAGEVVERPASVVKELVENAVDADAGRVAVAVENGGLDGIRVRDDGHGIPPDQLPRAVAEHATSKLDGIDQLDAGIGSLGFRGEALYTVGAVARLTVRSRTPDRDAGAELVVDHGETGSVSPAGCPVGTTVTVTELFAETPARRKFLGEPATEFDRINGVVSAYALANPDVAVSLEHDGREVFATPGDGNRRSAVLAVYGREVAEAMVDVAATREVSGLGGESDATIRVHGLVSEPETTRASRSYVTTFVDGRWVRDADLRSAVVDGYGGQLAADRYPFAVVFVAVPPAAVDANVHPRKTEVRFDEAAAVYDTVREAVREGLLDAGLLRTSAPRGQSAPEETTLDPEVVGGAGTDHERAAAARRETAGSRGVGGSDESSESRESSEPSESGVPSESSEPSQSPDTATEGGVDAGETGVETGDADDEGAGEPTTTDTVLDAWHDDGASDGEARASDDAEETTPTDDEASSGDGAESPEHPRNEPASAAVQPSPREWQRNTDETTASDGDREDAERSGPDRPDSEAGSESSDSVATPSQSTLTGGATDEHRTYDTLPELRVLGQYDETYLVCETARGLVLVDQHAADERVNYERLRRAVGLADAADESGGDTAAAGDDGAPETTDGGGTDETADRDGTGDTASEADDESETATDAITPAVQALASPVRVPLTAREAALFDRFRDALVAAGFHAERAADDRAVLVTAVPAVFDATLDPDLLRDTLVSFAEETTGDDRPVERVADDLLADLACYPSITGNTSLTDGSAADLLAALDDCENPYACPHGRPVLVEFGADEIDARFERDYPGHGSRRE
ncbi:DNA mismatch repair endonuclease MutL [Halobaculum sp. MBLA0147]|uniref:DNA mismatch repair endonuclease MutL n=1 Tax=Halobaculum sp. MBLA0147 TaxID=3079934 RepID=UPI003524BC9E